MPKSPTFTERIRLHQDVFGFQITMENPLGVQEHQGIADLHTMDRTWPTGMVLPRFHPPARVTPSIYSVTRNGKPEISRRCRNEDRQNVRMSRRLRAVRPHGKIQRQKSASSRGDGQDLDADEAIQARAASRGGSFPFHLRKSFRGFLIARNRRSGDSRRFHGGWGYGCPPGGLDQSR